MTRPLIEVCALCAWNPTVLCPTTCWTLKSALPHTALKMSWCERREERFLTLPASIPHQCKKATLALLYRGLIYESPGDAQMLWPTSYHEGPEDAQMLWPSSNHEGLFALCSIFVAVSIINNFRGFCLHRSGSDPQCYNCPCLHISPAFRLHLF